MEKLQVLIIDDDRDTATFYSVVMDLLGMESEIVNSAKSAIIRLTGSAPDVILLDMLLGSEISGEEILYQIRSNPRFDATRVVIITAYPSTTDLIANLADLVLTKPIEIDQLKTLVSRVTEKDSSPKHLPFRDPLTELFSKEFFFTRLDLAFERALRRTDFMFSVIVFEIYLEGTPFDLVPPEWMSGIMHEIAKRLRKHVRPTDSAARISGWRFCILCEEIKNNEDIQVILERLQEFVSEPVVLEGKTFQIHANYGTAFSASGSYQQPKDILAAAVHALEKEIHPSGF
jgi:diguanylate cyclase (GGDEF)-like protein